MPTQSRIINRIASLSFNEAYSLIPDLYDLILEEKNAWNAYCDKVQTTSYTHILRAYNAGLIDQTEWREQTLGHLAHTLPARLAILVIKSHDPEGGSENGLRLARLAEMLQAMREILRAGYPILFQLVDDIVSHETLYTKLEVQHADAVEYVRVALATNFGEGFILDTADVVLFAKHMMSIGINLEGVFGEDDDRGTEGEAGGVGILPWW